MRDQVADSLLSRAQTVAAVAALHCEDVDAKARFPYEALQAMKETRLLSSYIAQEFGGDGASLGEIAETVSIISQACGSAGMVYAMHQIKVSSLVEHGVKTPWHQEFMRRISKEQMLVGSATTEGGGIGGNLRNSICAVMRDGDQFTLEKDGALISYGEQSDAILITSRSGPDAPASDQVLACFTKDQYELTRLWKWDALGVRGTCSDGFTFRGAAPVEQILPIDFGEIAARSMLPVCHILWSAVWYGLAYSAFARAQSFVRAQARSNPSQQPPGALRVAECANMLQLMKSNTTAAIVRYDNAKQGEDDLGSVGFVVAMNNVKIAAARLAGDVVNHALLITGIHGYKNGTPYSIGRQIRDVLSAPIMISNDRIFGNLSNMLLMHRVDPTLLD